MSLQSLHVNLEKGIKMYSRGLNSYRYGGSIFII